jgi:hypothetical protein
MRRKSLTREEDPETKGEGRTNQKLRKANISRREGIYHDIVQ